MSRRALKGINWSGIAERLGEGDKNIYASFKSRSDQYLQRVMSLPEQPVKIDWAYYKQHVPASGMVEKFQKEYEALKVPYPPDNYTAQIEAEGQKVLDEVKVFIEESNKRIVEFQAEAEKVRASLPIEEMNMEEFAEAYPEHAINIDKPTIWPHIPEEQPGDEPEPIPREEH
ncbi:ATP synthase subunit d, mitochondrial [Venturia canescens]|uniref:ATP synthase subunit d, mitochondrial n=1 Tax=Venturia canescens TaxID=32260 RepID=UPI001C9D3052|nr:ATP synthase subunit d, mitochondrial [Venturia canescens]